MSNLENLTVLSLAKNHLEAFPEEISLLVQLKWLNLSGNRIPEIPECVQRMRYLEALWCNNAKVVVVDQGIGNCFHLNTLGLRGNLIREIPDSLSQLTNLTWLTLENNQLERIPESLEYLQNLVHCNLQNNRIEVLPDIFHKMRSLKYLFVNSNSIKSVHLMDLYHTNHLKVFDLNHNPFPDEHILPVLKVSQSERGVLFSIKYSLECLPALPTRCLLQQPPWGDTGPSSGGRRGEWGRGIRCRVLGMGIFCGHFGFGLEF